ncbi:hypothetical protein ACHGLA_01680 [Streptomyces sp. YH02]|uniref:hypothetical protein n=1 Tax=Streptomyces sp. YH02 TaxID=3256999 RepID=UPI0037578575
MTNGDKWTAVGPATVGFETKTGTFTTGARISGRETGLAAACEQSGSGVHGTGKGEAKPGVLGSSTSNNGVGVKGEAHVGPTAFGVWGSSNSGLAGFFEGNVRVTGSFEVEGNKSLALRMDDGTHRILYAVEAPESWFEDLGFGELVDGHARVTLDPEFVAVTEDAPYHVFLTEYGAPSGLYVTDRSAAGFTVRSAAGSDTSGEFSYRVAALRRGPQPERFAVRPALSTPGPVG